MDRVTKRKEMLAYCLKLLDRTDPAYAMWAADFYEALEPWFLDGLGQRVRWEIERRNSTSGPRSRVAASRRKGIADAS